MLRSLVRRARPLSNHLLYQTHTNSAPKPLPLSQVWASHSRYPHRFTSSTTPPTSAPTPQPVDYSTLQAPPPTAAPTPIERVPLPPGVSGDAFGLYELVGTRKDWKDVSGDDAVLAAHGPEHVWATGGREASGAGGGVFAVVAAGGSQHKVTAGDVLYLNRVTGDVNDRLELRDVLVVGAYDWTVFGRPLIEGARVVCRVEEQTRTGKVIVAKFKKRKGYRRRRGHRQPITRLKIEEVVFGFPDKIVPHEVAFNPRMLPLRRHSWYG